MKVIIVILVSLSNVVNLFAQANDAACRYGNYDTVKPFALLELIRLKVYKYGR